MDLYIANHTGIPVLAAIVQHADEADTYTVVFLPEDKEVEVQTSTLVFREIISPKPDGISILRGHNHEMAPFPVGPETTIHIRHLDPFVVEKRIDEDADEITICVTDLTN